VAFLLALYPDHRCCIHLLCPPPPPHPAAWCPRVCLAHGIIEKGEGLPCPVDLNGRFTPEVTDFAGRWVRAWRLMALR
jgi:hypothetical protein